MPSLPRFRIFPCVLAVLVIGLLAPIQALSQSRVYEKDIRGEWRLGTELKEKGENPLSKAILGAVDGFMDGIDIRFHFQKDGTVLVTALGEEDDEDEEARWWVNDDGQLVISDDDNDVDHDVWMFKDGRLYAYDLEDGEIAESDERVFLERIDG